MTMSALRMFRSVGWRRMLHRVTLLGVALLVAACATQGHEGSPCLRWLTNDDTMQDFALSGDGTRAAVFQNPKSLFSRPAELTIYDARTGRQLASGNYGYSLKWIGDEIFMSATPGVARVWNPTTGITRTISICAQSDQDITGSCRFDIGPGGSVAWRTFDDPSGLAYSSLPGVKANWTYPISVLGAPGISPDGHFVAVKSAGGYFLVLETEHGNVVKESSGPFRWGNHKAAWISSTEFLVTKDSDVEIFRYNALTGAANRYLTIPLSSEPAGSRGLIELDANQDGSRLLILTATGNVYVVDVPCLKG